MKPIIGIVEWPYIDKDMDKIYEVVNPIVEKISENGGIPIGIFPTQIDDFQNKKLDDIRKLNKNEKEDLIQSLQICDAIIKPGAIKIYGFERFIYDYTLKKDIPYLGICAGMQMMANHNNKKIQNEKNEYRGINHNTKDEYAHKIQIKKDTLLYDILKEEEIMVNSRHNFHINNPGSNRISAYSEDGIIEAIENESKLFHIGLQWHPESLNDQNNKKIFQKFIESAEKYNRKR